MRVFIRLIISTVLRFLALCLCLVLRLFINLTCVWVKLGEASLRCIDPPNPSPVLTLYCTIMCGVTVLYLIVFAHLRPKTKTHQKHNWTLFSSKAAIHIKHLFLFCFCFKHLFLSGSFCGLQKAVQKFNWTHHTSHDTWNCTKEKKKQQPPLVTSLNEVSYIQWMTVIDADSHWSQKHNVN